MYRVPTTGRVYDNTFYIYTRELLMAILSLNEKITRRIATYVFSNRAFGAV